MASFSEIKTLKEERKALRSIESELNAQLQRLKIEELALLSLAKLKEEKSQTNGDSPTKATPAAEDLVQKDDGMDDSAELVDLDLSVTNSRDADMEEEEEESEEEPDQLTMFINDLLNRNANNAKT